MVLIRLGFFNLSLMVTTNLKGVLETRWPLIEPLNLAKAFEPKYDVGIVSVLRSQKSSFEPSRVINVIKLNLGAQILFLFS